MLPSFSQLQQQLGMGNSSSSSSGRVVMPRRRQQQRQQAGSCSSKQQQVGQVHWQHGQAVAAGSLVFWQQST
jgi:hypothetical protein